MSATYKIRFFIAKNLAPGEIFSTSQLLSFGTRCAIDQALCRMVKVGVLHRLARGLFIVPGAQALLVSARQAAEKKAAAFGHAIVEHVSDLSHRLGIGNNPNSNPTFATTAGSSSFLFNGVTRIHFRKASAKKRKLSETKMGEVIRSLWDLGRSGCSKDVVRSANAFISRSQRQELPSLAALMPTWLHAYFKWRASPRNLYEGG